MNFETFNLNSNILKSLQKEGLITPTEIQKEAIPHLLQAHTDFVGQAQTGTGKTAAFVLPLLERLDPRNKHIQALILTPTRELALQVSQAIEKLGRYMEVKSLAIYGGTSYTKQINSLKKDRPGIIVGTPGRVMDLKDRGVLKFEQAQYVVLDEADEMLNMGFLDDVRKILSYFHEEKRLWMFSATMPRPIMEMIRQDFKNPKIVSIKKQTMSNADIEERYYVVKKRNHREALCRLLETDPETYGLIFCRTRAETQELSEALIARGYQVETLHGEMKQNQRDAAMERFKNKRSTLMICTDVAARGIDVNNLTHVFNYGLPQDLESYVHRIGRTGRAGMKGVAVSLIDPKEVGGIRRIERLNNRRMTASKLPSTQELKVAKVLGELEKVNSLLQVILDKGDNFKLDPTFEIFTDKLKGLTKQDLLKFMFTWKFNRDLRHFDEMGELDETPVQTFGRQGNSRSRSYSGRRQSSSRQGSGGHRTTNSRRSSGGGRQKRSYRN